MVVIGYGYRTQAHQILNLQVSAAKRMPIKSFTGSVGNGEAFHYSDIST